MTHIDPRVLRYAPETSTLIALIASTEATIAALDVIHRNSTSSDKRLDARLAAQVHFAYTHRTMRRRSFVALALLLAVVALVPAMALATQDLRDGVYPLRAIHAASRPGAVEIDAPASRAGRWAEPDGSAIRTQKILLYARDNGNTQYVLDVRSATSSPSACGGGILSIGGDVVISESYGSGPAECSMSFEIDRPFAMRVATALSVVRQDRTAIGQALVGRFSTPQATYPPGQPIEIVLTIENPSTAPAITWRRGGRNRGARDNQFSIMITRDGAPVAPLSAPDSGGRSQMLPLAPGARQEVRAPLASWGDVSRPGRYVVECRYETELAPDGVDPYDDAQRGAMWDRAFTGTVSFTVRRNP